MQHLQKVLNRLLKRKGIEDVARDRFVKDVWCICRNATRTDLQSINAHLQLLGWPNHTADSAIIELVAAIHEDRSAG